jgi:hypothetical protein
VQEMITEEIVDCLASYFGFGDDGELTRYFCYHVIGGPGPTPAGGVASIVPLSVYDQGERCISCQYFHVATTGGPAAAVEKALRYLDAYHAEDRLRRVQTDLRGLSDDATAAARSTGGPPSCGAESARAVAALTEFIFPERRYL